LNISEWNEKELTDLSILELAYAHLGGKSHYQLKDGELKSILPIALQEINHVRRNEYSKNFVPVIGAFAVIEQIGFCYSRNDIQTYSNPDASPIFKALYYFAGYPEGHIDTKALYALRNAFLHNASLMAITKHKNKPSFYFQFDRDIEGLTKYSTVDWNGNIETFKPEMTTLINPNKLIELASSIADNALGCLEAGVLIVDLEGGEKELFYRFLKHFK
jgi:hypothetical protein